MRVERLLVPPLDNNVYVVMDDASREAVVVDTALGSEAILSKTRELGAAVKFILNTHGHPDHTADNEALRAATGAKIAIFEAEAPRLLANARNVPWYLSAPPPACKPDLLLREGAEVKVAGFSLRTLHTPGHTEGSACFYIPKEGVLFAGDTLFAGTCGRTDVSGGSPARMVQSLRRLAALPLETRVYPGHGPATTVGDEAWIADLVYPVV